MLDLLYSYASNLPKEFFSEQSVYTYLNANLLVFNESLANDLGIAHLGLDDDTKLKSLLGYNSKKPISQAYCGHQFGYFTKLGDGRAILIGEHKKPNGDIVDIHLKGAGLTNYSRGGDGKAALGPMLREYIIGEAMYHLGIPTSRILAIITTGENIQRRMTEKGAIAVRVASSHIRAGTFEYAATQGKNHTQKLLEYTINRHKIDYKDNKALSLLEYIIDKQTDLITQWERVGFIHGVMNTDNMAISGETIDYGPCAFMDSYNPDTVFSSIDKNARYSFANQSNIVGWNITKLAESLLPLISENQQEAINLAQNEIDKFPNTYTEKWQKMMLGKLGLSSNKNIDDITSELLIEMHRNNLDYTNTFYDLSYQRFQKLRLNGLSEWLDKYLQNQEADINKMREFNPIVIPRNHQVEKAISAAENGNTSVFYSLLDVLKSPYEIDTNNEIYTKEPNEDEKVKATFCGT